MATELLYNVFISLLVFSFAGCFFFWAPGQPQDVTVDLATSTLKAILLQKIIIDSTMDFIF